jgi:hypothetical protein
VWEAIFMLVLLKIPVVYLCVVVWWAIRGEPRDEQPAVAARVVDTPVSPAGWSRVTRDRRDLGGRRGPRRDAPHRPSLARGEARR